MHWIWIAAGGAGGTLLRYALSRWAQGWTEGTFPVGTLGVNVTGCLLMGFLGRSLGQPDLLPAALRLGEAQRLALLVGFLGGFTTFSTYAWESIRLMQDGRRAEAAINVLGGNALGLFALWIGFALAGRVWDSA